MIQSVAGVVRAEHRVLVGDGHSQIRVQDVVVGELARVGIHAESVSMITAVDKVAGGALGRDLHRSINHIMTEGPKITSTALPYMISSCEIYIVQLQNVQRYSMLDCG